MCGIIGIYKREGGAAVELYEGLLMLQHRGQDSAGARMMRRRGGRGRADSGGDLGEGADGGARQRGCSALAGNWQKTRVLTPPRNTPNNPSINPVQYQAW
jgi:hypothetical protein